MDEETVQQWADEVSVWLLHLAFADTDPYDIPLPPVLGESQALRTTEHAYLCRCPICRGRV